MNFWDYHGCWFLFFMFCFPRLTMFFATTVLGGVWSWVGWLFAPRLTVAIFATMYFSHTNIVLVVLAWFWALSGEVKEKCTCVNVVTNINLKGEK